MQNLKTIIIGAGPAGLSLAGKLEKEGISYRVIESSDIIGGQLTRLYPEKEIVDIPGIPSIKARDYIELLSKNVHLENFLLSETVKNIVQKEGVVVETNKGSYCAESVVIATGLGFSKPRPLGLEGEEDCENILYSLSDFNFLKNKRVAIFGGGDSALDWAKEISAISDDVALIHRRTEFRGNADTIKNCSNLKLYLPFVPNKLVKQGNICKEIVITEVAENPKEVTIPVDYIMVNYGNIANQNTFGLNAEGSFISVDENQKAGSNIFVIGDSCAYENKKRRIAPSLVEVEKVFKQISSLNND